MDKPWPGGVLTGLVLFGSYIFIAVAYQQWKLRRETRCFDQSRNRKLLIYQRLWEKLDEAHKKLFLANVVTEGTLDTTIADITALLHRCSRDVEEKDAELTMRYLAGLRTLIEKTDQVLGFQHYYLLPRQCGKASEIERIHIRIGEEFGKVVGHVE